MDPTPHRYRIVSSLDGDEAVAVASDGQERRVALARVVVGVGESPVLREQFESAGSAACNFEDDRLVRVFDFVEHEGDGILLTELVEGVSAAKIIDAVRSAEAELPASLALCVVAQAAHAIAYVREHEIANALSGSGVRARTSWQLDAASVRLSWDGDVKLAPSTADAVTDSDTRAASALLHELLVGVPPDAELDEVDPNILPRLAELLREGQTEAVDVAAFADRAESLAREMSADDSREALSDWLSTSMRAPAKTPRLGDLFGVVPGLDESTPQPVNTMSENTMSQNTVSQNTVSEKTRSGSIPHTTSSVRPTAPPPEDLQDEAFATSPPEGMGPKREKPSSMRLWLVGAVVVLPLIVGAFFLGGVVGQVSDGNAVESSDATPPGNGWLRIGGEAMLGAEVTIDEQPYGHAPLEVMLPAGEHRVVVSDEEGVTQLEQAIVIDARHTRAEALRILR